MASQYSWSRDWTGQWGLSSTLKGAQVKGPKGTLDNMTATSSSSNVHPNPHKQKTNLAKLSLVPLESLITSSPFIKNITIVLPTVHAASWRANAVVILAPLSGCFHCCAIRIQAGHKASITMQLKWFVLSLWCKLIYWNHCPLWLQQHKSLKMPYERHPH